MFVSLSALLLLVSAQTLTGLKRRDCKSATYYYGVVSTEMVCSGEKAYPSTTKCKKSALNQLCRDGTKWNYYCDLFVDVMRSADFLNKSVKTETGAKCGNDKDCQATLRYPVQWLMAENEDPAYYYKLRETDLVQFVYKVEDKNVHPFDCGRLAFRVGDVDQTLSIDNIWNKKRVTGYDYITRWKVSTDLLQPSFRSFNEWDMGEFHMHTEDIRTYLYGISVRVNFVALLSCIEWMDDTGLVKVLMNDDMVKSKARDFLKSTLPGMSDLYSVETGDHSLLCYQKYGSTLKRSACTA